MATPWKAWGDGSLICQGAEGMGGPPGVICDCVTFVAFVEASGVYTCPKCGARYRLRIEYMLPKGTHRGRKQMALAA